jgi:hypothetical protein
MKRLPVVVVLGVSRASRSAFGAVAAELLVFAGALSGTTAGLAESGVPLRQLAPRETRRIATIVARTRNIRAPGRGCPARVTGRARASQDKSQHVFLDRLTADRLTPAYL